MARRVLIGVVTGSQQTCTITFCASLLKLQVLLAKTPDVNAAINFFASKDLALAEFRDNDYDTMVLMDSHMGVSPAFILEEPAYDCVLSPYPLPTIDWDRVAQKLKDPHTQESPEHVGNTYNFDAAKAIPLSPRYLRIPTEAVKEMAVVKFKRGVDPQGQEHVVVDLEHPSTTQGTVAYTGCVGVRHQLRN